MKHSIQGELERFVRVEAPPVLALEERGFQRAATAWRDDPNQASAVIRREALPWLEEALQRAEAIHPRFPYTRNAQEYLVAWLKAEYGVLSCLGKPGTRGDDFRLEYTLRYKLYKDTLDEDCERFGVDWDSEGLPSRPFYSMLHEKE